MWRALDVVVGMSSRPRSPSYLTVDEVRVALPAPETSLVVVCVPLAGIRRLRVPLLVRALNAAATPSHTSFSEIARNLICAVADRHPRRRFHVVVWDGLVSPALRGLPKNVTVTVRMPANAVVHGPTPPKTGQRGRPRRRGDRLGSLSELSATAGFTEIATPAGTTTVKVSTAQWYSVFGAQPVQIVLARRPASPAAFDIALASTDLEADAGELLARYQRAFETVP